MTFDEDKINNPHFTNGEISKAIEETGKSKKRNIEVEVPIKLSIVGRILRGFRKIRSLSQEKVGQLVGVKKSQISKIEKGDKNLTLGTVVKLIGALKAKISLKVELDNKKELVLLKQVISDVEEKKHLEQ